MSSTQWLLSAALVICIFWMVGAHNRVIALRAAIFEAWAQMDTLLEQRAQVIHALSDALWDLWPTGRGAVDALRSAQAQLQTAVQAVRTRPSRAPSAQSLATAEAALNATVARVLNQVESEPGLHAHETVATQMLALFSFGPRVLEARQRFNDASTAYNGAIKQFPTRLLAPVFRFEAAGTL
jgi:LemA protein